MACVLAGWSGSADACRLVLRDPSPAGRIAGATVTFEHAAFETAEFPPGWTLTVDNDPSWRTRLHGHAIVGAAFIDAARLSRLVSFMPAPGYACSVDSLGVAVTLDVYAGDRIRPVRLATDRISLVD